MINYEDDCVGCPQGCIDCGRKRTPHYYCDECDREVELFEFEDEELCIDCIKMRLERVGWYAI